MTSKNPPDKRDYKKEAKYEDTPAQIAHREDRNRARAAETRRLGRNPVGEDIAHIKPMASGGKGTPGNVRVESVHKNRSWRAGQKGYHVPKDV
jgi:hypothetical protein